MDITVIWIIESTLTDGSKGYAVEIEGESFDCITLRDAEAFAEGFKELVEKHTNIEAGIMYP